MHYDNIYLSCPDFKHLLLRIMNYQLLHRGKHPLTFKLHVWARSAPKPRLAPNVYSVHHFADAPALSRSAVLSLLRQNYPQSFQKYWITLNIIAKVRSCRICYRGRMNIYTLEKYILCWDEIQ